ncbi:putative protease La YcbZ [Candidatus Pantoea carbekii]|nr:putative protease La YcbZ [Candidatus Pantoea carbekii]
MWRMLQPDSTCYQSIFSHLSLQDSNESFAAVQPRLMKALAHLHYKNHINLPILLLHSQENNNYLSWIASASKLFQHTEIALYGGNYRIIDNKINLLPPNNSKDSFTSQGGIFYTNWIESEQLFGCVRQYKNALKLEPGLIHRANGGTLILSLNILLAQPLLWRRLRKCLEQGRFDWYTQEQNPPLPVFIPPLPLAVRLILCGDRNALASFEELNPEIYQIASYSEFEENLLILKDDDMRSWCRWILAQIKLLHLPQPEINFWPKLINEAVRMTGNQKILPLCPCWLRRQIEDIMLDSSSNLLNAKTLTSAVNMRLWQESFLTDHMRNEILFKQINIQTNGKVIGQINSLSTVDLRGHPRSWGEPSRITCVVYPGDGELIDVEHKAELSGNIHRKGVMIMKAYLISELELDEPLPFSASLVFEQSYSEIDGDSASLAELCVLISALSNQPLDQQIAVTGSVDQFGNIQAVGGLNQKIESFFDICNARCLTGKQGVILPANNANDLSLKEDVVNAVRTQRFFIWTIDRIEEALLLLTGIAWKNTQGKSLVDNIRKRIAQFQEQEKCYHAHHSRWLKWFNFIKLF